MALTTYGRQHIGDHLTGKTPYTMPTLYAALYTSDPTAAGIQTSELTQFSRIEVTSKFDAVNSSGYAISNADFTFGLPSVDALPAAYIGYLDASSAGNMILKEAIPDPRPILNGGRTVRIKAGQATIQFI